ncbi:unnamed protein product [Meganyctiphanes norvegica]|uniref:Uncharacterized protein n=1 Tax=Meganyctiphanes norvegica TaxID=48144 RepID=A0AAV2SJI9_MEGNR
MELSSANTSRASAAIIGAAVADAAARPLHWIYRREDMEVLLQQDKHPEFWPTSQSPFYTLPTGARSCYNHVVIAGLEAYIEAKGEPDLEVYKSVIRRTFGDGTAWQEALARRKEAYSPSKRKAWTEPVVGPWLHGAVIHFLEHGKGDNNNTEMDGFLLCLPHLVYRAGNSDVLQECIAISSLLTGNSLMVKCQAQILQKVLLFQRFSKIYIEGLDVEVQPAAMEVFNHLSDDHLEAVSKFGNNCHLPGSFQGGLHAFLLDSGPDGFQTSIRATISAGGCNCSRANYAGALLGAQLGVSVIPKDWIQNVTDIGDIIKLVKKAQNL